MQRTEILFFWRMLPGRRRFHGLGELKLLSLLVLTEAGTLWDLKEGRIPNALTAAGFCCGLVYQTAARGGAGLVLCLGSALLPVVLLGWLYYFRMIGAGDIKLLCAVGGFLTPGECFRCIVWTSFFGGILCLYLLYRKKSFWRRTACFLSYVREYARTKEWKPYRENALEEDRFCFAVPVLLGTLCYLGGIY